MYITLLAVDMSIAAVRGTPYVDDFYAGDHGQSPRSSHANSVRGDRPSLEQRALRDFRRSRLQPPKRDGDA